MGLRLDVVGAGEFLAIGGKRLHWSRSLRGGRIFSAAAGTW